MSERHIPFAPGEWFHCFSRGVDKRCIFMDEYDAARFQMLLFAANAETPIHISDLPTTRQGLALPRLLEKDRGKRLVDVAAYSLMSNHYHLLLRELDYGGISTFMQKLGTAYTMYFNKKNKRTGALFSGKFKAVHVATDSHSRRIINYIHANPAELYEPRWKEGKIKNIAVLKKKLITYPFSSLPDYEGVERAEGALVQMKAGKELLKKPSFQTLLADAQAFYRSEKHMLLELE